MNQSKTLSSKTVVKGWTEMRLFDTKKFQAELLSIGAPVENVTEMKALVLIAKRANMTDKQIAGILDKCAKPLFNANFIWKFLKKQTGKDVVIPFLTGMWTTRAIKANTVTTKGKSISAQQFGGTTTAPVTAIAIGIGTGGTTALNSEITTGGGSRGAATVSNQTTTLTGDTEQYILTFTFTLSFAITEEGLFDNNASGGNMACYQTFSAVNVVNTDTLQVTHKVQYS
jgi:hypothetical protein